VADALRAAGRGFSIGPQHVPVVPAAIVFDLLNDGDKDWAENPYPALGCAALGNAAEAFSLGSHGAGTGATTAGLTGGLGSASAQLSSGHSVAALVVVNAIGATTVGDGPHFWAAPFEQNAEFGGRGPAPQVPAGYRTKGPIMRGEATTIAVVATDAKMSQAQATRMATAAHDGIARAIVPAHTPFDGDLVFAAATGRHLQDWDSVELCHAAATTLARAIARGVYEAQIQTHPNLPTWQQKHGG
jgi:D-aminopeptidase